MEIRPCRLGLPYRYVDPMESMMSNESCPKAQDISQVFSAMQVAESCFASTEPPAQATKPLSAILFSA